MYWYFCTELATFVSVVFLGLLGVYMAFVFARKCCWKCQRGVEAFAPRKVLGPRSGGDALRCHADEVDHITEANTLGRRHQVGIHGWRGSLRVARRKKCDGKSSQGDTDEGRRTFSGTVSR